MEYRLLGNSGLTVSAFSFGTMTFGEPGKYANVGETTGSEAKYLIDRCIDQGVNLFDTADVYAEGQSEEELGRALGPRRHDVLIATKFLGKTGKGVNDYGASRWHIINACEASLKRLKTDYIDIYQLHNQDLVTPPEETLRALDDLIRAGKVRYIGTANHSGWTTMMALATSDKLGIARYISQQIHYSLLDRSVENELLPLGDYQGVGALVWGPLASGYLTGKFRNNRSHDAARLVQQQQFPVKDTDRARNIVAVLCDIANEHQHATPSQVALNWVVRRGGVSSVIIGARNREQLEDNLQASRWSLTDEEVLRLDKVSELPRVYPYNLQQQYMSDRNPLPVLQPRINV